MHRDESATVDASTGTEPAFRADDPGPATALAALPARYEDLGPIAGGFFGEVRRVRDTLLDRVLAIKLLRPEHVHHHELRQRFIAEARITAQLQHPAIITVHDRGELPDGRLWFTMKEVRGRTLSAVIRAQHAASGPEGWVEAPEGWTFRRLVDAFVRITQAIAYAHSRGVVHRDLKPANLMVGEFAEVLVMDWGLARRDGVRDASGAWAPAVSTDSAEMTRQGTVLGTPSFMSPEQARGEAAGPASDIYALGAVLYCFLTGRPPHSGESSAEVLGKLLAGPHVPIEEAARGGPPVPTELASVAERALQRDIALRYPNAEMLANDVVAWLDGVRRSEHALSALDQARLFEPEIASLKAGATTAADQARAVMSTLRSFDPVELKRSAWSLEDQAARARLAVALVETRWMQTVQGALSIDPDLLAAHEMLANHHAARLVEAERARLDEEAARAEEMLRTHDRGRHAAILRGDGRVSIVTDPPDAEVVVERFVQSDRRLIPLREASLGRTPIAAAHISKGSYLLTLRAEGHEDVRYPVLIERDGHWDGRPPGAEATHAITLPKPLDRNEVFVAPSWTWIGGDPLTPDSLPRRRVWIDAFIVQRFPVTAREYASFLNDLVLQHRNDEAEQACPRSHVGADNAGELAFHRRRDGGFDPPAGEEDWPVVLVDWYGAMAYAAWFAARTGKAWRLLNECEREKATRGVDARLLPWGDHNEPTYACVSDASSSPASRESVHGHPTDESPYGIRGLAGNTRDWCINVWKHEGPLVERERLQVDAALPEDTDYRAIKGGTWTAMMVSGRAAARFGGHPTLRRQSVGIRLGRSFP